MRDIKQKFSRHRPRSIGDTLTPEEMGLAPHDEGEGSAGNSLAPPPCALSTPPPSATVRSSAAATALKEEDEEMDTQ